MTEATIYGEVRELIGAPSVNDVSNRKISSSLNYALTWMAGELEFTIVTDDLTMALTAEQQDYPLPSDFLTLLWCEHNGKRLEPLGLSGEDRDLHDWRGAESGSPTQFAIRGRRLYLLPKPDASAVSDDGFLTFSYIGCPKPMGPQGPQGLSDEDQWLLIHKAALHYCGKYPTDATVTRIPLYQSEVDDLLTKARGRWTAQGAGAAKHHAPTWTPFTGRTGGAR
jgi:hypothetical protein